MHSTSERYQEIIESKSLYMDARYFLLSDLDVNNLFIELYEFLYEQFGQHSVFIAKANDRPFRSVNEVLEQKRKNGAFVVDLEGMFKSGNIKTKTAYKRYKKETLLSLYPFQYISTNYNDYFDQNITPYAEDHSYLKKQIAKLFSEEDYVNLAHYTAHDFSLVMLNMPLIGCHALFTGLFYFQIVGYCLDCDFDKYANLLDQFAKHIQQKYKNINISIGINSKHTEGLYSSIFCPNFRIPAENKGDFNFIQLPGNVYLREVGWSNYISSVTIDLLGTEKQKLMISDVYQNGGHICLTQKISDTNITELKQIKSDLYELIMPGSSKFDLSRKPRSHWELVPVLDSEVTVLSNGEVQFTHKGEVDWNAIRQIVEQC